MPYTLQHSTDELLHSGMPHPFDALSEADLRQRACQKWQKYPPEVLPLWVADMDFPIAPAIKQALVDYARGDNFGYPSYQGLPGLKEALMARLEQRYHWRVQAEEIHPLSGIVAGLNAGVAGLSGPGEEVIVQTPIYPPFLAAIGNQERRVIANRLVHTAEGWRIDFEALEAQVTPAARLLMLCTPHNPSGRVWSRSELERLAEFALRHRLWVVADELHSDLTFESPHLPFASLGREIAERTVTLYGPTKTFNIAGLGIGFAISQNPALLERFKAAARGFVSTPDVMAQVATIAAYRRGEEWLTATLDYLRANRDLVTDFVRRNLPDVHLTPPEGTYLAWLDFRDTDPAEDLGSFLLEEARVALNQGSDYGPGGEGFARLNFATSRAILCQALTRIRDALAARG